MKIGELQDHCGSCKLIGYCADAYETPHLCAYEALEDVDEETYIQIADAITEDEMQEKLGQYKEAGTSPWDDDYKGAIYNIVCEKLKKRETEQMLLPCPFCRGKAAIRKSDHPDLLLKYQYKVYCLRCHCETDYMYSSQEAAETWNRRIREDRRILR